MPPSPSAAPGIRIIVPPTFTHWPAIQYDDEQRSLTFSLPVRQAGLAGSIGWEGEASLPFVLPAQADRISGLLPLPPKLGLRRAIALRAQPATAPLVSPPTGQPTTIDLTRAAGSASATMLLRCVAVTDAWPLARLAEGFPVDADGTPVVLLDHRFDPAQARRWQFALPDLPQPTGRAVLVGDPLAALGRTAWSGLDADQVIALDERYPHHAVLVALARLLPGSPSGSASPAALLPRTLIWCPGNQALRSGRWSREEERVLGAVRNRCRALGVLPRLVLALPPDPPEATLAERAAERRETLVSSALSQGFAIVDLARAAGPASPAHSVAPSVSTAYPHGAAQDRMRAALAEALLAR